MRICDAHMTGEVDKGCRGQRRHWSVVLKPRLIMAGLLAGVVIGLGTAPTSQAARQQDASESNSAPRSGAPVITAKPEHVTLSDGRGSAEIHWDTGNGSPGFVFVTEDDRKPVLFANGPHGSRVAPWIGKHHYVFELYGDAARRMLLARITVSGSERVSSQQVVPWRDAARWMLVAGLSAVLYFSVYLSATGPVRTSFPTEPTTSPAPVHVARNLFVGIAAFVCLDGLIFHSGLYVSVLSPQSYAGRIAEITRAEENRVSSGLREVLVLGDSRLAEGFSTSLANELSSSQGVKFVSLAEPAASANTWYYMVRKIDPSTHRYSARQLKSGKVPGSPSL